MSPFLFFWNLSVVLLTSTFAVDFKHPETCSKLKFVKVNVVDELKGTWYDFIHSYYDEEDEDHYTCAKIDLTYTKNQTGIYEKEVSKTRLKKGPIISETEEFGFPATYDGQFRNVSDNGNELLIYGILDFGNGYFIDYTGYQNYTEECEETICLNTRDLKVPTEALDKMKKFAQDMKLKFNNEPETCKGL